ncbi:MAG: thioredoxin family protein [Azonexus sp.]|jgi:thioredoxin-like negative regulator of GroEL|nr:thioredoxin family protein [Azonexus sp.]
MTTTNPKFAASAPTLGLAAAVADDQPWVICLCAEWCSTCREYRALFARLAGEYRQFNFAWVDIEDHADLADDFAVETFPTLLIASQSGTHFLGPLLPRAEALARLLRPLQPARPASPAAQVLLAALRQKPEDFRLDHSNSIIT